MRPRWTPNRARRANVRTRSRELGQVLPIFAVMSVVLLGGAALLTDVAFWWTSQLRMQRAADAAALAGAVYLPGNVTLARAAAYAEAVKNGYTDGVNDVIVDPDPDDDDPRKMIVRISDRVQTNFARAFCWDGGPCLRDVDVGVTSAATYVLPVPMGSPQNYYGVGFLRRFGHDHDQYTDHGRHVWPICRVSPWLGTWQNPGNAFDNGDTYSTQVGAVQSLGWLRLRLAPGPAIDRRHPGPAREHGARTRTPMIAASLSGWAGSRKRRGLVEPRSISARLTTTTRTCSCHRRGVPPPGNRLPMRGPAPMSSTTCVSN